MAMHFGNEPLGNGAMWEFDHMLSISIGYWPQGWKGLEQNIMVGISGQVMCIGMTDLCVASVV